MSSYRVRDRLLRYESIRLYRANSCSLPTYEEQMRRSQKTETTFSFDVLVAGLALLLVVCVWGDFSVLSDL
jgi:hypothetical protein